MRTLPGTSITTSSLGLGCAGLYRLPRRADRVAVIRAALAAGVRHFDVAPMYGLGRAEAELAPYLRSNRTEITVTTKFGIDASRLGRVAGRVQGPVRALLARRPGLQRAADRSGAGPSSGELGRLLYSTSGYDASSAARSLHHSLRMMDTDYVDVFALHDPMGAIIDQRPELVSYLDGEVRAGTIRCWGVAGELPPAGSDAARVLDRAAVVQRHDDVFAPAPVQRDKAVITFGSLSQALPALLRYLADAGAAARWGERLGEPLDDVALAALLLCEAVRRNATGVVLFSTTRAERVGVAVDAVTSPDRPTESSTLQEMTEAARQHLS
ncbi:MAG: aldo/keto reductase [Mycobacteriales bacterium]